jgi:hypothetical protein
LCTGLDFSGTQSSRSDKTHIATKDVSQPRQLIRRDRAQQPTDRVTCGSWSVSCNATTLASASGIILRNLHAGNLQRRSSDWFLAKKIGPPSSSLIIPAIAPQIGGDATRPIPDNLTARPVFAQGTSLTGITDGESHDRSSRYDGWRAHPVNAF